MNLKNLKDNFKEIFGLNVFFIILFTFQWNSEYFLIIDVLAILLFLTLKKRTFNSNFYFLFLLVVVYYISISFISSSKIQSFFFLNYLLIFFMFLHIEFKDKSLLPSFLILLTVQFILIIFKTHPDRLFFKNHSLFGFVILWLYLLSINNKKSNLLFSFLLLVPLYITKSKTAIILWVIYIVFKSIKLITAKSKKLVLSFLIVVLILSSIFLFNNFKSDPFIYGRLKIFKTGYLVFKNNLFFGVGPFNFRYHSDKYKLPAISPNKENIESLYKKFLEGKEKIKVFYLKKIDDPHNILLQLLSEFGIIGTFIFLLLFIYIAKNMKLNSFEEKFLLFTILIFSLLHNFFFSYPFFFVFSYTISLFVKKNNSHKTNYNLYLIPLFYFLIFIPPQIVKPEIKPFVYSKEKTYFKNLLTYSLKNNNDMYLIISKEKFEELYSYNKNDIEILLALTTVNKSLFLKTEKKVYLELYKSYLKKAEYLSPKSVFIKYEIAKSFFKEDKYKKALSKVNEALNIEPYFYKGIILKIKILKTINKKDELKFFTKIKQKIENERGKYKFIGTGRYEKAILY